MEFEYRDIENGLALAGEVTHEDFEFIVGTFRGFLYIATEYEDGNMKRELLSDLSSNLEIAQIPINFHDSLWHQKGSHVYKGMSIETYHRFSSALESLPKPLLISCSDSRRASAVYAAYDAVHNNLRMSKVVQISKSRNLKYLMHAGLLHWVEVVVSCLSNKNKLVFRQLFDPATGSCTYLLADKETKDACLIDPVVDCSSRDLDLLDQLNLRLQCIIETHVHSDHISGSKQLKKLFTTASTITCKNSGVESDTYVENEGMIQFGGRYLVCRKTPGHTQSCCSYVMDDFSAVFTGDALFVRGCGRVDYQGGSTQSLFHSIHDVLFKLPSNCKVYPGHDYEGLRESTVGEERVYNSRFGDTTISPTVIQNQSQFEYVIETFNSQELLVDSEIFITANKNLRFE